MTGASIAITLDDSAIRASLERLMLAAADLSGPLGAVGNYLAGATRRRFETNVGPDGKAWTPSRRAIKENGRTLVKRGHLRDSMTYLATPASVAIGTNVAYAAIHQFGGLISHQTRLKTAYRNFNAKTGEPGSRFVEASKANFASDHWSAGHVSRMPARPFLGADAADLTEILAILRDHLTRIAEGA